MKKHILVIDDKLTFRKLISITLSDKYEVTTAQNGFHAMMLLQNGLVPDAVISDLMMPQLDGKGLTKQLRLSGLFQDIPIIIMSSIDKSAKRIELLKAGADDYILKPVNVEELELRIEKLINRCSMKA